MTDADLIKQYRACALVLAASQIDMLAIILEPGRDSKKLAKSARGLRAAAVGLRTPSTLTAGDRETS